MLNVKISINDGKGKEAEIEINEADSLSKLVIIDKVFRLFGIESDVFEMVDTYSKIGDAYSNFFNEVKPIEPQRIDKTEIEKNEIKEQLIKGLTENKEELESTYKETNDQPDYLITGIKIGQHDGKKRYKLRYECYACYFKGTHYVYESSKKTWCHKCRHELTIYPAHPEGFPNRDSFGNYFRAGEYQDMNLKWDWN
ncbi:hypothetical protein [Paenibacillus naphthalenovorans]|uniref:Uncharacterized protein n=1 Tax=Paenibacillus naphthalenovorans TaxID=162209 RepID=A0A0U2UFY2_9BACL|nr:hypothetical protein [Paenibacillus naphthalenovorans]ALS22092.1 hypothetical protein IJ22_17180 [Paenibacillus naphthalenovorans]